MMLIFSKKKKKNLEIFVLNELFTYFTLIGLHILSIDMQKYINSEFNYYTFFNCLDNFYKFINTYF